MSFVSKKMRASANGEACVNCGSIGSTVLAHLPYMGIADGGSSKCDDFIAAYLCNDKCHPLTETVYRRDLQWRYQVNAATLRRMFANGTIKA